MGLFDAIGGNAPLISSLRKFDSGSLGTNSICLGIGRPFIGLIDPRPGDVHLLDNLVGIAGARPIVELVLYIISVSLIFSRQLQGSVLGDSASTCYGKETLVQLVLYRHNDRCSHICTNTGHGIGHLSDSLSGITVCSTNGIVVFIRGDSYINHLCSTGIGLGNGKVVVVNLSHQHVSLTSCILGSNASKLTFHAGYSHHTGNGSSSFGTSYTVVGVFNDTIKVFCLLRIDGCLIAGPSSALNGGSTFG